ncbi:AmmeMemoRadiSam system protein B [Shewanella eurypsychrophilus]|uniref:MEMO1 family protein FM038_005045 n=1 Tax=Shewanella eurypsychrophilus TaxID=2593656 RepID=A0ABX6V4U4_9GAMM|nr:MULTISPECIES: AmmeMemoRadiSam system protein B [Shewanella]QFU21578.1 AmmeMemoRadiSam system protein B [Shewanella sp. YLB-09]QPG56868.1 AmmeMemoRadiSam system protein B [Shewanella eurypsychrophilus]
MLSSVRAPAVAGLFYPADPIELMMQLDDLLVLADKPALQAIQLPKIIIVPHAGYIYSGLVAAHAFNCIAAMAEKIKRVVLIGPAHTVYLHGCALPQSSHFKTPLGKIAIDKTCVERLLKFEGATISDMPHQKEHSLEVQLPFLQHQLTDFTLVPILVGDIHPEFMADILEQVWLGDETLIVVSTDLSHFHHYDEAKRLDKETCQLILDNRRDISSQQACGCRALNAIALLVCRYNLNTTQLSYQNSGDCTESNAGDKSRVVGYASFAIS